MAVTRYGVLVGVAITISIGGIGVGVGGMGVSVGVSLGMAVTVTQVVTVGVGARMTGSPLAAVGNIVTWPMGGVLKNSHSSPAATTQIAASKIASNFMRVPLLSL